MSVEHVVKRFGKFHALDDISFTIPQGSTFGIIGPNGAGKSTLLRVATALAHPTSGRVLMNGVDVQRAPGKALAGTAAIIDTPAFYLDLSARANLDIMSHGKGRAYKKKREELAEYTGIGAWMNHKVREFSLGMKQRLAISLAMLPESKFVILDEPTNGLDPSGIVDIRMLLKNLNRDFNATILVTSHMLSEIEKICTDIAILNHGKIAASGKIEDLLNRKPTTRIVCSNAEAAEKLLTETPEAGVEKVKRCENGVLIVSTTESNKPAKINELLVKAGIEVSVLAPEPDHLEKVFLEVTQSASKGGNAA